MKLERNALVEAVDKVRPGIDANSLDEHANMLLFDGDRVVTFCEAVGVSYPIETGITGGIALDEFSKLIKKIKTKEIDVEKPGKGQVLKVTAGKTTAEFVFTTGMEIPPEPDGDWEPLPVNFEEAMKFAAISAATDSAKGVLNYIRVSPKEIVSCDNHRLTWYPLNESDAFENVKNGYLLISATTAKSLAAYGIIEFIQTGPWAHFRNADEVVFSTRSVETPYPDINALLVCEGPQIEFPTGLIESLERAEILASDTTVHQKAVNVKVSKTGQIVVVGETAAGKITEKDKCDYTGDAVEFDISTVFFRQILHHVRAATVGPRSLRFDSDKFAHVVSLAIMSKPK